ncbi:MAG: hypothetical protein GY757_56715 [bacterium]|nr:hypothetical protein [bacterium]
MKPELMAAPISRNIVAEHDPLKEGLKQPGRNSHRSTCPGVAEHDPLKEGLKRDLLGGSLRNRVIQCALCKQGVTDDK